MFLLAVGTSFELASLCSLSRNSPACVHHHHEVINVEATFFAYAEQSLSALTS